MKKVKGDLLKLAKDGEFDAIVHGCNCFNTMGSGIAYQIAKQFPKAQAVDLNTIIGNINKLGNYTISSENGFVIINAYTQYSFSRIGEDVFEYASFEVILRKLANDFDGLRWGFPYIGMGLAGGDAMRIMALLEKFDIEVSKKGGSVSLVEYEA